MTIEVKIETTNWPEKDAVSVHRVHPGPPGGPDTEEFVGNVGKDQSVTAYIWVGTDLRMREIKKP